jgi:hexosaminidase
VALDNTGNSTTSNNVRAAVGMIDLALNKKVVASSGESPQKAVDGDYHTMWSSAKSDDEWIYVDLGRAYHIGQVNLLWGWKIHAEDFSIDIALERPERSWNWATVYSEKDHPYITWEATYRIGFRPVRARYIRLRATKRAGRQTWGGYQLAAFEVPVPSKTVSNTTEP